jgi:hypothetical protein
MDGSTTQGASARTAPWSFASIAGPPCSASATSSAARCATAAGGRSHAVARQARAEEHAVYLRGKRQLAE